MDSTLSLFFHCLKVNGSKIWQCKSTSQILSKTIIKLMTTSLVHCNYGIFVLWVKVQPEGYHQIQLHEGSRNITTFATHEGLFRYKHLIYGVNSVESFQQQIEIVISSCLGNRNNSDVILIWGSSEEEHNHPLATVLARLTTLVSKSTGKVYFRGKSDCVCWS